MKTTDFEQFSAAYLRLSLWSCWNKNGFKPQSLTNVLLVLQHILSCNDLWKDNTLHCLSELLFWNILLQYVFNSHFTTRWQKIIVFWWMAHLTFQRFNCYTVATFWSGSKYVQFFHFNPVPCSQRKAGYWAKETRGAKEWRGGVFEITIQVKRMSSTLPSQYNIQAETFPHSQVVTF